MAQKLCCAPFFISFVLCQWGFHCPLPICNLNHWKEFLLNGEKNSLVFRSYRGLTGWVLVITAFPLSVSPSHFGPFCLEMGVEGLPTEEQHSLVIICGAPDRSTLIDATLPSTVTWWCLQFVLEKEYSGEGVSLPVIPSLAQFGIRRCLAEVTFFCWLWDVTWTTFMLFFSVLGHVLPLRVLLTFAWLCFSSSQQTWGRYSYCHWTHEETTFSQSYLASK